MESLLEVAALPPAPFPQSDCREELVQQRPHVLWQRGALHQRHPDLARWASVQHLDECPAIIAGTRPACRWQGQAQALGQKQTDDWCPLACPPNTRPALLPCSAIPLVPAQATTTQASSPRTPPALRSMASAVRQLAAQGLPMACPYEATWPTGFVRLLGPLDSHCSSSWRPGFGVAPSCCCSGCPG